MDVRDRAILMLFAIYGLRESEVAKLRLDQASRTLPSIAEKHISPHCLRHSCAVHLLRSGVDINTIRAWLGHVSLDTTHIYSEVDLEIKAKALALCDLPNDVATKPWHSDPGLIGFLKSL
jgi:integrase/recombinase XerD